MSGEVFAAEAFAIAALHERDMVEGLRTRSRDKAFLDKYRTLIEHAEGKAEVALEGLAIIASAVLVRLAEEQDAHARTREAVEYVIDERNDAQRTALRNRLAWLHARERAQGQRVRAEYAEEERDGLRQGLNDWIADAGDDRVRIVRDERDQALLGAYAAEGERDDARHDLKVLREVHKDLDERYLMALADHTAALAERDALRAEFEAALAEAFRERDETAQVLASVTADLVRERDGARAEVVRLGRELAAVRTTANHTIKSLAEDRGGDSS
jgi:hypothetical protein